MAARIHPCVTPRLPSCDCRASEYPPSAPVSRDEALAGLASRCFASRGPATVQDFAWWSGLAARDAREAVEMVKGRLGPLLIESGSRLPVKGRGRPSPGFRAVHLLPAYDELMISYADRGAILARVNEKKAISNNGIFYPTIVAGGQVVGVWSRRIGTHSAAIEASLFRRPAASTRKGIAAAARRLEAFWGTKASLAYRIIGSGGKGGAA